MRKAHAPSLPRRSKTRLRPSTADGERRLIAPARFFFRAHPPPPEIVPPQSRPYLPLALSKLKHLWALIDRVSAAAGSAILPKEGPSNR